MAITKKKRSQIASVFRCASFEKALSMIWNRCLLHRGAKTASKRNASATRRGTAKAAGNCSVALPVEESILGNHLGLRTWMCHQLAYRITDFSGAACFFPSDLSFDFELGGSAGLVCGGVVLAFFEEIGHFQAQVSGVGGIAQTGVELDDAGANELLDFAIEMLHVFGAAIAHGVQQRLAFALALFHVFARAHGGLQDFHCGDAP